MKLFKCIVDDGKNVFKTLVAAKTKKQLIDECGGNGTFEKITDVTSEYFAAGTLEKLDYTLSQGFWGEGERKIICALVEEHMKKHNREEV